MEQGTGRRMPVFPGRFTQSGKERPGISGSTLKMIAVISMLVDHIAAGILSRYLHMYGIGSLDTGNTAAVDQWMSRYGTLYRYACRLQLFAAVSEIPFDLAFNGRLLEAGYQNVFFTLFFGFVMMMGISQADLSGRMGALPKPLFKFAVIVSCMAAAQFLRTDYGAIGVLCMAAVYLFRKKRLYQVIAGCVAFSWELTAPFAFIPVWFYNGKRGWNNKYFFYLFYPVHLLLIYLVCAALGITQYRAG